MSRVDEARYGKVCLLVLNVCPFTLRHVIDSYSIRHGSLSLFDFLEKNKHSLFHLYAKRCCCRSQQGRATPMYKSQWESLFMKNTSTCAKGVNDCPCQYNARPGITTKIMDVTMCYLVINNICSGVNVCDVNTIREIRNKLIHAASGHLDQLTFTDYWSKVTTALLSLAWHVSSSVHKDTLSMINELQKRVMNPEELGELRKVVMDEKRIKDLEVSVTNLTVSEGQTRDQLAHITATMSKTTDTLTRLEERTTQNVNQTEREISRLGTALDHSEQIIDDHSKQIDDHVSQFQTQKRRLLFQQKAISDIQQKMETGKTTRKLPYFFRRFFQRDKKGIKKMRYMLMKISYDLTKSVQLSALQDRDDELPIELLFASVVIREDLKQGEKGRTPFKENREVTDIADIFKKDGKEVRKIYMLGDAAHGKTTYCLWLLQNWCTVKNKDGIKDKELQSCEKAMKNFDFVFLVQLRYVDPNLDSVIDMICEDLFRDSTDCHRAIRHVLSSGKYRSLIIMDGLDEWNPNGETRKQLTCQGMPNIRVSSTVTCFISMRPWMFALISKMVKVSDRVIEILGLSETGMENVIENVLLNYYELKDDKSKFTKKYNEIVKILNVQSLKSFMQIPLLAVVCVQIWYEGKQVGDSMTSFYAEMLNMLIERALAKHELHVERNRTIDCELPQILSTHEKIVNCFPILLKLGKTAYEGLLSNDTNLVFQKSKLEKEIGMSELQFALDVGLISQREARSLTTKNVSVHFFHKSIQEFLAVIYIVTRKEVGASFCKYLCNIKVIMELSNVIMFICGMCPSLGSAISQRVVSVTDRDAKICDYRKSPGVPNSTVEELYKLQISWYRELQYGKIESQVAFHVSDVYLWPESDIETVRWTRKLLSDHLVDMRSLFLLLVPTNRENGISDTQLNDFLCNKYNNTRSLIMVRINGHDTDRTICPICIPSLRCLYLHYVKINHTCSDGNGYPPLLSDMTSLRVLQIGWVNLGVRGLELSAGKTHIEEVRLDDEKMTEVQWQQFILSVLNIQRRFNVKLFDTNIDNGSRRKIRSSPGFTVTRDGVGKHGGYEFYFTREWPIFVSNKGSEE